MSTRSNLVPIAGFALLAFAQEARALPVRQASCARSPGALSQSAPFVENRGQWADSVRFTACGGGWRAALDERGWNLALAGSAEQGCVVGMHVADGSAAQAQLATHGDPAAPLGEGASTALSHFFYGGRSGVGARSFASVRYRELVPGVDVRLRCDAGHLEYDLELAPQARLDALVFAIEGASVTEIRADGSLALATPLGELVQPPPRAFELDAAGVQRDCTCTFVRLDGSHFGFELRERRPDRRLVIDPALIWSTYIGGNATQSVTALADAGSGTTVIAGSTESFDFPTTPGVFDVNHNGASDVFVAALDGQGQLLWSTFLGGLEHDAALAVAVDVKGIAVAGTTRSLNFPATSLAYDTTLGGPLDGFVARLSPDGRQLLWCTYLGGTKNDELHAVALNASGQVTVAGWSNSTNYPVTPFAYSQQLFAGSTVSDGCVTRLSKDGRALVWSSYIGGSSVDTIDALALTPAGEVLIAGSTQSSDFPCTIGGPFGGEEGFVARLDPSASQLLISTTIGSGGDESVHGVACDGSGNVFVAGRTTSAALPVTAGVFGPAPGGQLDAFLARLGPTGALQACTYLGGTVDDEILALARSATGELFATGWTNSPDFPALPGAYDRLLNSGAASTVGDAFVIRCSADLTTLIYSTYFGGADDDRALAIAVQGSDTVLLCGETASFFFPTTPGAHRTVRGVSALLEGFASRLELLQYPIPYGAGKVSSTGATPLLAWIGFPSVGDNAFELVVDSGVPNQPAVVFVGASSGNLPFQGGTLYVQPPVQRIGAAHLDFVGYAEFPYAPPAALIGSTFYAQAWCKDPGDPQGCGLSNALEVRVYP